MDKRLRRFWFCDFRATLAVLRNRNDDHLPPLSCSFLNLFLLHFCFLFMDGSSTLSTPSTTTSLLSATSSVSSAVPSDITELPLVDAVPAHHASPVVAFIIGLAIVLLASILNAAGLNLTKLDHVSHTTHIHRGWLTPTSTQVRTSAIPKASRRKDWLRPLWLLGMVLYM